MAPSTHTMLGLQIWPFASSAKLMGRLRRNTRSHDGCPRSSRTTLKFLSKVSTEAFVSGNLSDKVDLIVKGVCAECNSGWMSTLENGCKPLLTELLHGREVKLSRDEQRTLCIWVTKTVMVMAFLGSSTRAPYFTADERKQFTFAPAPAKGTVVFLAGYVGRHAFWGTEHPLVFKDDTGEFPGYSATMGFGGVVIQTFSHRAAPGNRWFKVAADFDVASIEIWPRQTESVVWPPEEVFDDEGLRAFAERWMTKEDEAS